MAKEIDAFGYFDLTPQEQSSETSAITAAMAGIASGVIKVPEGVVSLGAELIDLGFEIIATKGTAKALEGTDVKVKTINKVLEGRPHIVDAILNKEINMIINTTEGRQATKDSASIRRSALEHSVFFTTTISGGFAITESLEKGVENWTYKPLQSS